MRARSIRSLTPAVYLDYKDINRPSLAGSGLDRQTDRQTLDADTWQNTTCRGRRKIVRPAVLDLFLDWVVKKKKKERNAELLWSNLNFFKSDAAWQGIAGRSGFSAKTSISSLSALIIKCRLLLLFALLFLKMVYSPLPWKSMFIKIISNSIVSGKYVQLADCAVVVCWI